MTVRSLMQACLAFAALTVAVVLQCASQEANGLKDLRIQQRDQLAQQAIDSANAGQLDKSISLLEEVYKLEQSIYGEPNEQLMGTLDLMSRVAQLQGNSAEMIKFKERKQAMAQQLFGEKDYRTEDALREVADARQYAEFTSEQEALLLKTQQLFPDFVQAFQAGEYLKAKEINEQRINNYRELLGEGHPSYVRCMSNLAVLEEKLGNFSRAAAIHLDVIEISKATLGAQHPSYATSLNNLAVLYNKAGKSRQAQLLHREALAIREAILGKEHPDYSKSLSNLAAAYFATGDYLLAEPLLHEAKELEANILGKWHRDFATTLGNLAALYEALGDYAQAEELYYDCLDIEEKTIGKQHPDFAVTLNGLASLYLAKGNYVKAERLYRDSLSIMERTYGKNHPGYAGTLSNLGVLHLETGDYALAASLLQEALEIRARTLGKHHPDYANSINSLAYFYRRTSAFDKAIPLYLEVLELKANSQGTTHPEYATSLNNLAVVYLAAGELDKAESLLIEAKQIREKAFGRMHPKYANSLNSLVSLYETKGMFDKALEAKLESLHITRETEGEKHPHYAINLTSLGCIHQALGDDQEANKCHREALEITLRGLEMTAAIQSQRQQIQMSEKVRFHLDNYLSLAIRVPKFQQAAYGALLRWKGRVWRQQQQQRVLAKELKLMPIATELTSTSSRLATLTLNPPANAEKLESWRSQIEQLAKQRENLERDLSLASAEYGKTMQVVTPDQLQESIADDVALLDFLEYNHFSPANAEQQTKESWEQRLLAFVTLADQQVTAIDLGASESLRELVQTWREDLGASSKGREAATEIRQQIWEPIEKLLEGISTVYVSPDGALGTFPLGALPGKNPSKYLLEEKAIVLLPVPQGLPEMAKRSLQSDPSAEVRFCLVGGVDYNHAAEAEPSLESLKPAYGVSSSMLAARGKESANYQPLPGSLAEIEAIAGLLRKYRPDAQVTILKGADAGEAEFASLVPEHRFLHVATHGFFAPESVDNALSASIRDATRMNQSDEAVTSYLIGQHPDLLSGLVFAGANQSTEEKLFDGILTAAEVQGIELDHVELAILSACETGLGKTAGGEGIIGLQRAFQLAGAKTTITSLWQVDDSATQALMTEFYHNLFGRKLTKLESLRQAQIWLLNNPDAIEGRDLRTRGAERKVKQLADDVAEASPTKSLPAYWAAFQLSGAPY